MTEAELMETSQKYIEESLFGLGEQPVEKKERAPEYEVVIQGPGIDRGTLYGFTGIWTLFYDTDQDELLPPYDWRTVTRARLRYVEYESDNHRTTRFDIREFDAVTVQALEDIANEEIEEMEL